jgi:hypothetical protein
MTIDYLAGIVDGEGCIMLHPVKRTFQLILKVSMKNQTFILSLISQWGGRFDRDVSGMSSVRWSGEAAGTLLTELLPHLQVKRQVAEIALRFWTVQGARYRCHKTPDEITQMVDLAVQVRQATKEAYH